MDNSSFNDWLQLYGKAWTQRRPDFEGINAITFYWQGISQTQKDISFEYKIVSVNNDVGIAHFVASFLRQPGNVHVKLDGIFQVTLNSQNKCTSFSEWWQSHKS
jgi:hypothetical protein